MNLNRLVNPDIQFEETTHTYTPTSVPNLKLRSCTEFIKNFFEPFDKYKIANKLVDHIPKYRNRTVESLIEEWEAAADHGKAVHKEIEDYISSGLAPSSIKAKHGANWFCDYSKGNNHDFFTEAIIYSEELRLAGTIDLLVHNKSNDTFSIIDWKTNKKIDQNSYQRKMGRKHPTSSLMDCNFTHYTLQMSLYKYILEEYYDFKVTNTKLIHLTEDGYVEYNCDYLVTDIRNMIKYFS